LSFFSLSLSLEHFLVLLLLFFFSTIKVDFFFLSSFPLFFDMWIIKKTQRHKKMRDIRRNSYEDHFYFIVLSSSCRQIE
jgi:hypothetical protein